MMTSDMKRSIKVFSIALVLLFPIVFLSSCAPYIENLRDLTQQTYGEPPISGTPDMAKTERLAEDVVESSVEGVAPSGEQVDRLLVKTRYMLFQVKDIEKAIDDSEREARRFGGSVTGRQVYTSGPTLEVDVPPTGATVQIKVPVDRYEDAAKAFEGLGQLRQDTESVHEVTEQYIDLDARLRNMKKEEERFLEIFDKATKVEDLLAVEREIARVRGEIESMTAQLEFLKRQAAHATFNLEFRTPETIVEPAYDWGFVRALRLSLRAFVNTVNVLIVASGGLLPLLLIALLVYYAVKLWRRKRRRSSEVGVD